MSCAECAAFESAFKAAGVRFAAATYELQQMTDTTLLRDAAFLKLQKEEASARHDYQMAKEALRVHQDGHKKT